MSARQARAAKARKLSNGLLSPLVKREMGFVKHLEQMMEASRLMSLGFSRVIEGIERIEPYPRSMVMGPRQAEHYQEKELLYMSRYATPFKIDGTETRRVPRVISKPQALGEPYGEDP